MEPGKFTDTFYTHVHTLCLHWMGLYTELIYAIIPNLSPYFLLFCYPHKYLKKNHFYLAIPHIHPLVLGTVY